MNTQTSILFNQISASEVKSLTTVVKETLAFGHAIIRSKTFSAAELWNIQRQRKSLNSRRRFL